MYHRLATVLAMFVGILALQPFGWLTVAALFSGDLVTANSKAAVCISLLVHFLFSWHVSVPTKDQ